MALSRRTGAKFQASIWPGFVDAMTGLLLVLMFVLTIFMVVQFVLQETIKGQGSALQELSADIVAKDDELRDLSDQIAALGDALGLERMTAQGLQNEVNGLSATLANARDDARLQQSQILALTQARDTKIAELADANSQITDFEAQVAQLISQKQTAEGEIANYQAQVADLQSRNSQAALQISDFEEQVLEFLAQQKAAEGEQAGLTQSLAAAQATIAAQVEAAELAQKQREALDAMLADIRTQAADAETSLADTLALLAAQESRADALQASQAELQAQAAELTVTLNATTLEAAAAELLRERLANTQAALSQEEQERLAQAAAAERLRKELEDSQAALTAMTLNLDDQRRKAEETLALLAAAQSAGATLDERLSVALLALTAAEDAQALSTQDLQDAREAGEVTTAQLQEALIKLKTREAELTQLQASLLDAEGTLSDTDAERSRLAADLVAAQNTLAATQAALVAAQSQATAKTAEVVKLQEELTAQQTSAGDRDEELAQLKLDLIAISAQRDAAAASLANADQDLLAAQATVDQLGAELKSAQDGAGQAVIELRAELAQAILAVKLAQDDAVTKLSDAERTAALLATAEAELGQARDVSTEAQRQVAALSQEVQVLRAQLGGLQETLGDFERRDEINQVEIAALGGQLNSALAAVAAEERKTRLLQEAENQRLIEEAERLAAEAQTLERYKSEFLGQVRSLLEGRDGVRIVGDRFVFSSEVLFPPGGAELSDAGKGEIAKIASLLREIADQMPDGIDWVLQVDGHTDNQPMSGNGDFSNNWELSQARALSVVLYMVNFLGLPPERLSANGFGQHQPLNPADTVAARAQNRRIELKFTEK